MVTRRKVLVGFGLGALSSALPLFAQQGKVWRVGVLETTSKDLNSANYSALRKGLQELGYVEGKNLLFEYRSADGRPEKFEALASELARLKVDVILTRGTPATHAASKLKGNIPVVTAASSTMVESGFAKSLSHPGGKVTGLDPFASDLFAKRVQLLKELLPKIARIGSLLDMGHPLSRATWEDTATSARSLGVDTELLGYRKSEDLPAVFDLAVKQRVGAIIVGIGAISQANRAAIVALAARHRLPAMYASREFIDEGGLISYAVSYPALYYRAASFLDKIFKGAKPGDLPIERATKFELVLNLKSAKALGVTIPPSVRLRADEVIE